jgi:ribonuclease-3
MSDTLKTLQSAIGYDFSDENLLETALTHPSAAGKSDSYQRLEFLGDRVLGLVVASFLYRRFPDDAEGDMAKRFSALVDGPMCAAIARRTGLGPYIRFSEAEHASGSRDNDNILADVIESLIGAAFLDSGFQESEALVQRLWGDTLLERIEPPVDPKTALQEWSQARALGLPEYALVSRSGPDHAPSFEISVRIEGKDAVTASGLSRRAAEKEAARAMLAIIDTEGSVHE